MNVCLPGRGHDVLHGDVLGVVPVGNVLRQGPVEQDWLLGDDTQLGSDPRNIESLDVVIVKTQHPGVEVIEPLHQLNDGRFSTPRLSNKGYRLTFLDAENYSLNSTVKSE